MYAPLRVEKLATEHLNIFILIIPHNNNYETKRISNDVFPYEERVWGSPDIEQMDIQMSGTGGRVKKD